MRRGACRRGSSSRILPWWRRGYFVLGALEHLGLLVALLSLHVDGDVGVEGCDCEAAATVIETHATEGFLMRGWDGLLG